MNAARQSMVSGSLSLAAAAGAVLAALAADPAASPDPAGSPEASPAAFTVLLEHREVPFEVVYTTQTLELRAEPFDKEPASSRGRVFRGQLHIGGTGVEPIPFLWDQNDGRLYLDLNRNGDLTDDADGTRVSEERGPYQLFDAVRLPAAAGPDDRTVLVNLNLYGFREVPFCYAGFRSYPSGKITGPDQEWEVGLIDDPGPGRSPTDSRRLLMRPWADRDRPFSASSPTAEVFPWTDKLFLNGQAWTSARAEPAASGHAGALQFTPVTPPLGELEIKGASIERLVLAGDPWLVVLHRPPPTVRVPTGDYPTQPLVLLGTDVARAYRPGPRLERRVRAGAGGLTVTETGRATLTAGGPLNHSVRIGRRGQALVFHYELLGADGGTYRLLETDRSRPPEFVVFRGEDRIASGRFEYG